MKKRTPTREPGATASMDLTKILLFYASGIGVDTAQALRSAGLAASAVQDADARVSLETFNALWETVAQQSGDDNFGLHFGESFPAFASGHILFTVMMNCGTVGKALETFFRYHGLMADFVSAEMIAHDVCVQVRLQPALHPISLQRHHSEAIFGIVCALLRHLTGGAAIPAEVRFTHRRPKDATEHRRVFGSLPRFGQPRNELMLRREHLTAPLFLADPELLEKLEPVAHERILRVYRPDSWSDRVAQTLQRLLAKGEKPRISLVASTLALSARSLQNRLQEEGTTYREILDRARKETALDCLRKPGMPLCDVAFLLGFSEQSAFNHAFQRWTGRTPGEFRKRNHLDSSPDLPRRG